MPFADAGFARRIASISAAALSTSFWASNDFLPTTAWMMPVLSTRYSTLPALFSRTALRDVHRDGAELRVRHQAARAEHLTEPADDAHHVGRRDHAVELEPALVGDLLGEVLGADEVGARLARLASPSSPFANTSTRTDLPMPCGSTIAPRTIWSACFGSTPRFIARSTLSSNFAAGRVLEQADRVGERVGLRRGRSARRRGLEALALRAID